MLGNKFSIVYHVAMETAEHLIKIQHDNNYMNHVQSVFISDIPPAGVQRFKYGNIPLGTAALAVNLLHSRWYIADTHLLAMIYILHTQVASYTLVLYTCVFPSCIPNVHLGLTAYTCAQIWAQDYSFFLFL